MASIRARKQGDNVFFCLSVSHSSSYLKFANWLEDYADALELNVWLASEAVSAVRDNQTAKWNVTIRRADGATRVMQVDHVVLAQGFTFGRTPSFPGQVRSAF